MAHIQIRRNDKGGIAVLVDGVNVADDLVPDGLQVDFSNHGVPRVTMTFRGDPLDMMLPDEALYVRPAWA